MRHWLGCRLALSQEGWSLGFFGPRPSPLAQSLLNGCVARLARKRPHPEPRPQPDTAVPGWGRGRFYWAFRVPLARQRNPKRPVMSSLEFGLLAVMVKPCGVVSTERLRI